jgi:hypothetical protein
MLQRAQKAMGGADQLAAIKDLTEMAEIAMAGAPVKVKQTNRFLAPGHLRQDLDLPFGKVASYTDGKSGWMVTPQGSGPMNDAILKQAQGEMFRNIAHLIVADRDSSLQVNAVGDDTVEISGPPGSVRVKFDASTGLPLNETYTEGAAPAVETFSDWRDAGSLKMPFKITVEQNGKKVADVSVVDYKVNAGLKPEDLSKKP